MPGIKSQYLGRLIGLIKAYSEGSRSEKSAGAYGKTDTPLDPILQLSAIRKFSQFLRKPGDDKTSFGTAIGLPDNRPARVLCCVE